MTPLKLKVDLSKYHITYGLIVLLPYNIIMSQTTHHHGKVTLSWHLTYFENGRNLDWYVKTIMCYFSIKIYVA